MKHFAWVAALLLTSLTGATELNYATYFGGIAGRIVGLREMPDGGLLFVGSGGGAAGVSLNGVALDPSGCIIARLSPGRQRFDYISYLSGLDCTAMDLDPSGRILVVGRKYIARISADGRSLDHLASLPERCLFAVRSGPDGIAYLAGPACGDILPELASPFPYAALGGVVLRYNFALARMDAKTYFGAKVTGLACSGLGSVYVYGAGETIPIVNPLAAFPKGDGSMHAYVAEFSADLKLTFSTYLDGLASTVGPEAVVPDKDGRIWIWGAGPDINSVFAAHVDPAAATLLVTAGSADVRTLRQDMQAGLTADGRLCSMAETRDSSDRVLACTSGSSIQIEALIPDTSRTDAKIVLTRDGGFWTADRWARDNSFDAVPYSLKASAAVPYRTSYNDDFVLRHYSANLPVPTFSGAVPVILVASERANIGWEEPIFGSGFLAGMQLEVDGHRYPLTVLSFNAASISGKQFAPNLRAGEYQGRLVNPGVPDAVSSAIPVTIRNAGPSITPFVRTNDAAIWRVQGAVYDTSSAYWNGAPLPLTFLSNGEVEVHLPAGSLSGELRLLNPPPGGGESLMTLGSGSGGLPDPNVRMDVSHILVDADRGVLYAIGSDFDSGVYSDWRVVAYSVPDGRILREGSVPNSAGIKFVDWQITPDGGYLYLAGDNRHVYRIATADLHTEADFMPPLDVALTSGMAQPLMLRVLPGERRSILVTTAAGRMVIYDGDQPRAYTTSDYPSKAVVGFQPLFATPTHVYAMPNLNLAVGRPPPCLVRYPYDRLGFDQPEDICDIAGAWGRWDEMKIYAGSRYLQYGNEFWQIAAPTSANRWVIARKVWCDTVEGMCAHNLNLVDLATGSGVAFYPPDSPLVGSVRTTAFVRGALVYHDYNLSRGYSKAIILPDWRQYAFH